ncbi:LPXTG cell wall anchor domain-containing protein [Streptomyces sp. NPDC059680]|uniref:LPXTG cell wall anchor domain-containing protein n=1 Tax=Streptomyces TaxID=1883 RepID=UPI001E4467AB|nr:LPXTG cell wall anchor domain-containing protein [Streptomyces barringtoniae]MCC5480044.1 LPXTG cell wall anchor domain-containing protein [Streptomyces barringtoniae]
MRTLIRAGAVSAGVSAALFLAPAAHAAPPGDNGDVKIHKSTTDESDERNQPHVCSFYLDAFHFDGGQQVDWRIEVWAPTGGTKGTTVKSGALSLDGDGHGRTSDMTLPDGHYKLFWNFAGEKGAAKHKVFWTDCQSSGGGGGTPSSGPSSGATSSASPAPSSSPSSSVSPSSSAPGSASSSSPAPSSSPSAQGGGGLAETGNGVPVGALSGVAAVLVGAGGYLVVRRRKARG